MGGRALVGEIRLDDGRSERPPSVVEVKRGADTGLAHVTRLGHDLLARPVHVVAVAGTRVSVLAATPADDHVPSPRTAQHLAGPGHHTATDVDGRRWAGRGIGPWRAGAVACVCVADPVDSAQARRILSDLATLARDQLRLGRALREVEGLVDLLGTASHDLRNPLSVLRAGLETLTLHNEDLAPGESDRIAELAVRQARRMTGMIDGLLALTGDAGDEEVDVDLCDLVRDTIDAARLAQQDATLAFSAPLPDDPVVVRGSGDALARVLTNLVTNAVEHGGGRVWLRLSVDGGEAVVEVADDGPGMPPDSPLATGERARRAGGHGLGLVIVRRIVQHHDGDLRHHDRDGGGTVVVLRLPLHTG